MMRSRLLPTFLLILTPTLLTLLLVMFVLRSDLQSFVPISSDEIYNWRQIATFRTVGFEGGYYAHHEQIANVPFTHFGAWGPLFPMLYGSIARIAGWALNSPPLYNLVILGLALALLVRITRPNRRTLWLLIAAVGTYWTLLLYAPTAMQESFNHALAIVLAGTFYVLITRQTSARFKIALALFICAAALIRLSWAFLLLPFALLSGTDRRALRLILALFGIAALLWLSRSLAAPYPYVLGNIFGALRTSPVEGIFLLWAYIADNLRTLLLGGKQPFALELLLNYQFLFCLFIALLALVSRRSKERRAPDMLLHLLNLAPALLFVLTYFVGYFIGYRHMAMHLLFTLILAVLLQRWRIATPVILSNALFIVAFLWTYQQVIPSEKAFHYDTEKLTRFEQTAAQVIHFDASADAWCNTVLAHNTWDPRFLALPPQIGYSVVLIWDLQQMPPKSRYIVSDPTMEPHLVDLHLEKLAQSDDLIIYRNLDANCS
ncbi:MAG: hypothetical protein KF726_10530 [Anaerolineae bacterium]|nr:hypothetical protein [Anaerolineae bacterium]